MAITLQPVLRVRNSTITDLGLFRKKRYSILCVVLSQTLHSLVTDESRFNYACCYDSRRVKFKETKNNNA